MNAKLRSSRHERMLLWKRPSETTSLQRFTSYRAPPLLRCIFAALVLRLCWLLICISFAVQVVESCRFHSLPNGTRKVFSADKPTARDMPNLRLLASSSSSHWLLH
ncbi:hypothetical protein T01_170 [Trichinella spiralis]|uniref:Transmembrane protein n=1 Tax=Trichinella spiralis TaxID=6334 RepID=A0A0V1ATL9_TRISP|nr:hypothetical protein T01_170 [Trichinella spiralis]